MKIIRLLYIIEYKLKDLIYNLIYENKVIN